MNADQHVLPTNQGGKVTIAALRCRLSHQTSGPEGEQLLLEQLIELQ
jgi:hypothetical protein